MGCSSRLSESISVGCFQTIGWGLGFAFAAGLLGSLPLAMVYHWIGNFPFNLIILILAALGVG
jgi:hypothetical protein